MNKRGFFKKGKGVVMPLPIMLAERGEPQKMLTRREQFEELSKAYPAVENLCKDLDMELE